MYDPETRRVHKAIPPKEFPPGSLTQPQGPPLIFAQGIPPVPPKLNERPKMHPVIAHSQTVLPSARVPSSSQFDRMDEESGSQLPMASTQVLPGPHGGRPVKKKPVKKRLGGF